MEEVGHDCTEYDTYYCIPVDHCPDLCVIVVLPVEEVGEYYDDSAWGKCAVEDVEPGAEVPLEPDSREGSEDT